MFVRPAGVERVRLAVARFSRELARLLRVIFAPASVKVVGYTKHHPIYSDFFEANPISGFRFHRPSSYAALRPLDRLARRRIVLLHRDAASPRDSSWSAIEIVECEGRPSREILDDPRVAQVFVQSRWASKDLLETKRVQLLRPVCLIPAARRRARPHVSLLVVGHGGMLKGLDALDKAWRELRERYADVRLIIAGSSGHNWEFYPEITRDAYDAADFPGILERFRTDDRVQFGPQPRELLLRRTYGAADVYLHLARMETFGYSVLEAMVNGLPVVATRLNAIPEMVRHDISGYLIDVSGLDINAPAWREHVARETVNYVSRLLDEPELRVSFGEAGRRRAAEAFSPLHRRDVLERTYAAALRRVPAPRVDADVRVPTTAPR